MMSVDVFHSQGNVALYISLNCSEWLADCSGTLLQRKWPNLHLGQKKKKNFCEYTICTINHHYHLYYLWPTHLETCRRRPLFRKRPSEWVITAVCHPHDPGHAWRHTLKNSFFACVGLKWVKGQAQLQSGPTWPRKWEGGVPASQWTNYHCPPVRRAQICCSAWTTA